MVFGGVSAFLYELYKLHIFSNSQSRTAEMKEETNKKHQLRQDCKKKAAKKKQKARGINLGTKSEGSGINFVPKKRCLFHSKKWC